MKTLFSIVFVLTAGYTFGDIIPGFRPDYTYKSNLKAFYKFHSTEKSFFEAWAICNEEDSTIALPTSKNELDYLKSFNYYIWLGLHDMNVEGTFAATDGQDLTKVYTKWEDEEPNNYGNNEDCVILSLEGLYNDIPCNLKRGFVCKKESSGINIQSGPVTNKYRDDYIYIKELDAFYKYHEEKKIFTEAVTMCEAEGTQLLIPYSEKEVKYMKNYMMDTIWLGIHDTVVEGKFQTIDGKNISGVFIKWEDGEPNDYGSNEDCLVLLYDGTTNDIPCHLERSFVCKIRSDRMLGNKTVAETCEFSDTIVKGGNVCKGQLIFEEHFDQMLNNKWIIEHRLPVEEQENGFMSYQRTAVSLEEKRLKITPTLQRESEGFDQSRIINGVLDLTLGCTAKLQKYCRMQAESYYILPPIISGRISTKGLFSFKYGKIEIKAKLPQGDWIYPELYLEPSEHVYGSTGYESGLMRIAFARGNLNLRSKSVEYGNKVLSGGIILEQFEPCRLKDLATSSKKNQPWGNDYHVYGLTWNEHSITLEVDNEVYGTIEPPINGFKTYGSDTTCKSIATVMSRWATGTDLAPFDQEFYITIGLGVGGVSDFPKVVTKPWKNTSPKAKKAFLENESSWYGTWQGDSKSLLVDSVKVWAL